MAAMDLFAQGRRDVLFRTDSGRRLARTLFQQALVADSTFAPAYAHLALNALVFGDHDRRSIAEAEQAARTAVRLDSLLPDGHGALGRALMVEYRFAEAEKHLERALELDPASGHRAFLIWLYMFMERPSEALEQAEALLAHDPSSATAIAELAHAYLVIGRCDEALAQLAHLRQMQPPPARAGNVAAQCYATRKEWPQAIAAMRRVAATNDAALGYLGYMFARGGQPDSARAIRDTLLARRQRGDGTAYGVAVVYAGFGDFDAAFQWLTESYDDRSLRHDIMGPLFDDLRSDPRFQRLREKLGIQKR
jgi:tetratricopeptide (TPR) repeat protein